MKTRSLSPPKRSLGLRGCADDPFWVVSNLSSRYLTNTSSFRAAVDKFWGANDGISCEATSINSRRESLYLCLTHFTMSLYSLTYAGYVIYLPAFWSSFARSEAFFALLRASSRSFIEKCLIITAALLYWLYRMTLFGECDIGSPLKQDIDCYWTSCWKDERHLDTQRRSLRIYPSIHRASPLALMSGFSKTRLSNM